MSKKKSVYFSSERRIFPEREIGMFGDDTCCNEEEIPDNPCGSSNVINSDNSYQESIPCGDTLELPDITHTDSDGSEVTLPAQTPFVATPCSETQECPIDVIVENSLGFTVDSTSIQDACTVNGPIVLVAPDVQVFRDGVAYELTPSGGVVNVISYCQPTTVNGIESNTSVITVLQNGLPIGTLNPATGVVTINPCPNATVTFDGQPLLTVPSGNIQNIDCNTLVNAVYATDGGSVTGAYAVTGTANGREVFTLDASHRFEYTGTNWRLIKPGGDYDAAAGTELKPWNANWSLTPVTVTQATISSYCRECEQANICLMLSEIEPEDVMSVIDCFQESTQEALSDLYEKEFSYNVIEYTTSGTYTPSPGVEEITVVAVGAGGGGGSGRIAQTSTSPRSGGQGGGGGAMVIRTINKSLLGPLISVNIGAGGLGGAARVQPGTNNGAPGLKGGDTSLGILVVAEGGAGGGGGSGTDAPWSPTTGGRAEQCFPPRSPHALRGGLLSTILYSGTQAISGLDGMDGGRAAPTGGNGGGSTSTNTQIFHGNAGGVYDLDILTPGGTTTGENGINDVSTKLLLYYSDIITTIGVGTSGAGGARSLSGNGGPGGTGGRGAGGGGGGAQGQGGVTTGQSGRGGNGGQGFLIIIEKILS